MLYWIILEKNLDLLMHEFEIINKYFTKLSKNNKTALGLNDEGFFDKKKVLLFL